MRDEYVIGQTVATIALVSIEATHETLDDGEYTAPKTSRPTSEICSI